MPVALGDAQVILQGFVGRLERVVELEALEEIVVLARLVTLALRQVDGPAHGPHRALLALDPDHDRLVGAGVVDPLDDPLGEAALRRFPPHGCKDTIV